MGLYVPRPRLSVASYSGGNGLLNGLLGYWPMDEASGNLLDAGARGADLVQQTTIGTATGKVYATARLFDESAKDYATCDDAAIESVNEFTIAYWVCPLTFKDVNEGNQVYEHVAGTTYGTWSHGWTVWFNRDGQYMVTLNCALGPEIGLQWHSGAFASINEWTCAVVWFNPGTDEVGIEKNGGAESYTTSWAYDMGTAGVDFCVGRAHAGGDSYYFDGRMGPMAIWNRALGPVERALWYNGGAGLAYSGFEP